MFTRRQFSGCTTVDVIEYDFTINELIKAGENLDNLGKAWQGLARQGKAIVGGWLGNFRIMKKSELKLLFDILGGDIVYKDKDYKDKIAEYKKNFDGKSGELVFTIIDGPEYWQHKYLHGYLLPAIAEAQGEKDLIYLKEYVLKQEFLFKAVNDLKEIPSRHRSKARIIERQIIKQDGEIEIKVIGYVPSTTTLTFKEMREFILRCEEIMTGMIEWEMPAEARLYRKLAFNEN